MIAAIPLLLIVVAAYHVVVMTGASSLSAGVFSVDLLSGAAFTLTISDLLIAVGLLLLYIEILKSTRASSSSIVDHLLSMVLFVVCLVEFIVLPGFGTSTFFVLMLMTFVDVIAGFTVTINSARRDIGLENGLVR